MSERIDLVTSVASTIRGYRQGEIAVPTPEHVERWLSQFSPGSQLALIRELDHVLKQTYLHEEFIAGFLSDLVTNKDLAGADPKSYWKKAHLLDIQSDGSSQTEMLKLLSRSLDKKYGLEVEDCGSKGGDFIYIDDVIFTGGRATKDLVEWIKVSAPAVATLHVIVIAWHKLGQYHLEQNLNSAAAEAGKKIGIRFWSTKLKIENRFARRNDSGVLWPTEIPDQAQVKQYVADQEKFPFKPRVAGGALGPFSSEAGRAVLEREFLIAGVKIRSMSQNPSSVNRPLGHGFYGIGFGSTIVTYRNCPNNCPLAFWWGDPSVDSGHLNWYPLFPREGYSSPRNVFKTRN